MSECSKLIMKNILRTLDYLYALLDYPGDDEIIYIIEKTSDGLIENISDIYDTLKSEDFEGFDYEINNKLAVLYEWIDEIVVFNRNNISNNLVKSHITQLKNSLESFYIKITTDKEPISGRHRKSLGVSMSQSKILKDIQNEFPNKNESVIIRSKSTNLEISNSQYDKLSEIQNWCPRGNEPSMKEMSKSPYGGHDKTVVHDSQRISTSRYDILKKIHNENIKSLYVFPDLPNIRGISNNQYDILKRIKSGVDAEYFEIEDNLTMNDSAYSSVKCNSSHDDLSHNNSNETYARVYRQLTGENDCLQNGFSYGDIYASNTKYYVNVDKMNPAKLLMGNYIVPNTELVKYEYDKKYITKEIIKKILDLNINICEIKTAPIDAIVGLAVISDRLSKDFQHIFVNSYRNFISSFELIKKLQILYFISLDINKEKVYDDVPHSIISFLITIFDSLVISEIELNLVKLVSNFTHTLIFFGQFEEVKLIRNEYKIKILELYFSKSDIMLREFESFSKTVRSSSSFKKIVKKFSNCNNILDLDSFEIAKQLTLRDWNMFESITPTDVYDWIYRRGQITSYFPKVAYFLDSFDSTSLWCQQQILNEKNNKSRVKVIKKLVKTANYLFEFKNIHSYLAVSYSLDSQELFKLNLPSNIKTKLIDILDSVNWKSFKEYSAMIQFCDSHPAIPHFGVTINSLQNLKGEVNQNVCEFENCLKQLEIFKQLKLMQERKYNFEWNDKAYQVLKDINPTTFSNFNS